MVQNKTEEYQRIKWVLLCGRLTSALKEEPLGVLTQLSGSATVFECVRVVSVSKDECGGKMIIIRSSIKNLWHAIRSLPLSYASNLKQ